MNNIQVKENERLFVEKYRPQTIADACIPERISQLLMPYVDRTVTLPSLILNGSSGCGKTTAALALCNQRGAQVLFVNGSLNGNIDTLRGLIYDFCVTRSLEQDDEASPTQKVVLIDEADFISSAAQAGMRGLMEEMSNHTSFIMTCNYANKIIPAIHSRSTVVNFTYTAEDKTSVGAKFFKRCLTILKQEGIEHDSRVVAQLIKKHSPDFRKVLMMLQSYAAAGKIDVGILTSNGGEVDISSLMTILKERDFNGMRNWVKANLENDMSSIYRKMFDSSAEYFDPSYLPELVLLTHDYKKDLPNVADQEISAAAYLTHVMGTCKWR